jgi:Fic family protein
LYSESDENDATYFVLNQLAAVRNALDDLYAYLEDKQKEARSLVEARGRKGLNDRQLAILHHAVEHPDAELTIDVHQRSHSVAYQTARTDLLKLVDAGYLPRHDDGKRLYFLPIRNLARKLSAKR